ncbi:hypothetical protein BDV30DRAFT_118845 [Aspergillus minisclerotigenes]|uniref:Uncharacterized protein n=1 Tax=Aspergillus minisclerotigenes TaxID=656917 RepID=A0A5N6J227_9EURO|nr:hypothetical protein BDV30DRAFT_118845 [Aspergillus minisclerotigenes]
MQFQNSVTVFVVSPRPSMVHIRRLMREIHQLVRHVSIESILVFLCSSCYWAHFPLFSFFSQNDGWTSCVVYHFSTFFNRRIRGCREGVQEFSKALLFTIVMILNTIRGWSCPANYILT